MYSAFLQAADGSWSLCGDTSVVLEHEGDMLFNQDEDEQEDNLEVLAACEGRCATLRHRNVLFTDEPVYDSVPDSLFEDKTASCLVSYPGRTWSLKGDDVQVFYSWDGDNHNSVCDREGWVVEKHDKFLRVSYDHEKWSAFVRRYEKVQRKKELERERSFPLKPAYEGLADKCAVALGCHQTKSFRVEQLITWLHAHDVALGKRATNKLALEFARRWYRHREKCLKYLKKWGSKAVAERTDARLLAVVRKSGERV